MAHQLPVPLHKTGRSHTLYMATVHLPISTFSRKILLTEYAGAVPITPGRADWLSDMLRIDRSDTRFPEVVTALMSEVLPINVSAKLADRILQHGPRIGAVIHRHHMEQLTRHMLASSMGIANAKAAMQAFYDHYGIDDDDVSQESVYREFSRFKRTFFSKKSVIPAKKSTDRVRRNSQLWHGMSGHENRLPNAELDAICNYLDEQLAAARIRRRERLCAHAHIYLYSVRGGRSAAVIAKRFKKHPATVYRAMGYIRARIRRDRRFAQAIMPILDPSFVLPAPPPPSHLCPQTPAAAPA